MSLSNLETVTFPEKFSMTTSVEALLKSTGDDAYSLSMLLIISARLGNKPLYRSALMRMNTTMETVVEPGPLAAWYYGRILFAAYSVNDEETTAKTLETLNSLLEKLLKDDTTRLDRFTAWALGYVAALDKTEFSTVQEAMLNAANHLTRLYGEINASAAEEERKQETRSDALWAWVLIAQAAANAGERDIYNYSIEQMMAITMQPSIADALSKGLLRAAASNDYPAWAIAIVRLAAQTIGDEPGFKLLETLLEESISGAKLSGKAQETLLAQVNAQVAIEREKLIVECSGPTRSLGK